MIFLTNEHIAQVLDMKTCIAAMEDAYCELNELKAGYRPRIDFYVPTNRTTIVGERWKARRAGWACSRSA